MTFAVAGCNGGLPTIICQLGSAWRCDGPAERTTAHRQDRGIGGGIETNSWFPLSALRPRNRYLYNHIGKE
jgi:hypothetical protein